MRNKDFIPRSDWNFLSWANNFVDAVAASSATFNISADEVAQLQAAHERFSVAWHRAYSCGAPGPAATREKNEARRELVALCRRLATKVRAAGATAQQRIGMGLPVASDDHPQTARVPAELPILYIDSSQGRTLRVSIGAKEMVNGRARPRNTAGAVIFACFEAAPSSNPRAWSLIATTTTRRAIVKFRAQDEQYGRVWLSACWVSPTLRRGPMSEPTAAFIPRTMAPEALPMLQAA